MSVESIELSASPEDYLAAIHHICDPAGAPRMRDIARRLKVRTSSANAAVGRLVQAGLVSHERYEYVELTARGHAYAQRIVRRHRMLKHFLSQVLGVSPEVAERDACQLEHGVSPETTERLVQFMEALGDRPGLSSWLKTRLKNGRNRSGEPT
jgi:DtxR family Mn-dependent transcriptional regulator